MTTEIITKLSIEIDQKLLSFTEELQKLGISHIGHGLIVEGRTPTAFFSSKEWANRYGEEGLINRDPIRACALQTNYHIIPWDAILATKEQKMVLNERKRVFEAKTGILISVKTLQFHETFVLGCASSQYDIFHLFNNDSQKIFDYLLKFRKAHLSYYV